MKKIKKNGFTLVELLAVIVILAIILAIAIPSISNVIDRVSRNAFESDAKMVLKAIEYENLENGSINLSDINETTVKSQLNIDNSNYQTLTVKEINDERYITIVGKNKWDKLTVSGTKRNAKVTDTVTTFVGGANAPVLTTGMTPTKWNGTAWVNTTETDTAWYNYNTTNKIWANAKTADGSFWVWIPRYVYRISEANWHTSTAGTIDIQFSKGVDDNWNKAIVGNIDVREDAESSNAGTNGNKYTNHPAFTFGDAELTGIWVAKFEASGTASAVNFLPNVASLRSQTINIFFTSSRNMETNTMYGWGTSGKNIDTHMMKNTEWGAVAYLAQSNYGKSAEIWINPSSYFITGCAGATVSAAAAAECANAYNTANGLQASTTGNIYGIYDMSGGALEYTSDYVDNGHSNLNNGSIILAVDNKYKDVYTVSSTDSEANNYALVTNKKGEAVYETSTSGSGSTSWNSDYSYMPRTNQPWFLRGGAYYSASYAGGFSFLSNAGGADGSVGFRVVLLLGEGL